MLNCMNVDILTAQAESSTNISIQIMFLRTLRTCKPASTRAPLWEVYTENRAAYILIHNDNDNHGSIFTDLNSHWQQFWQSSTQQVVLLSCPWALLKHNWSELKRENMQPKKKAQKQSQMWVAERKKDKLSRCDQQHMRKREQFIHYKWD